jgi:hypothetical protein
VRALLPLGLSLALLGASCADPSGTDPSDLLTARVASIRVAVENGNAARAQLLLDRLESVVGRLLANDSLSEEQAAAIVTAADDVADALSLIESGPPPSFSPSASPDEEPSDEEHGNDKDKDKGKGKGHDGEGED